MSKKFLLIVLSFLSISCFSQLIFEKGYFINESNEHISCFINNEFWKNSPREFNYKLSLDSEIRTADIQNVKEFGINDVFKYYRAVVKVDELDNTSKERKNLNEEQVFLKVLIEGKVSLYQYKEGNVRRYFFKVDDSEIEELDYDPHLSFGISHRYRQQLYNELRGPELTMSEFEGLEYKKRDLIKIFMKYYSSENSPYTNFNLRQDKNRFNLSIRPGLNFSDLLMENFVKDIAGNNVITRKTFRLGIEAEFLFFKKRNWSLAFEPTYQYFNFSELIREKYRSELLTNFEYQSIDLAVSVRRYFFIKNVSKIFINASIIPSFTFDSKIDFFYRNMLYESQEILPSGNFALGMGYKYKDKISLQISYQTPRPIFSEYHYWRSEYKTLSIILGFAIF